MFDAVIIPTFARPEYLALCLEYIAKADGGPEKHIFVYHDRHINDLSGVAKEIENTKEIIERFRSKFADLQFTVRQPHPWIGNPSNFLEAYKAAYENSDVRFVYLIEDDVLVGTDFFRWHEAAQAQGDYFISVGWHDIRNPEAIQGRDPNALIVSTRDFSSIGACWRREKLGPFVRHAKPEFYRNMAGYLGQAFPGSPIKAGQWTEQAGVVTRLLHETRNRWVVWPQLPRCFHIGVSGYHRPAGRRFGGKLDERISELKLSLVQKTLVGDAKEWPDDINLPEPAVEWNPADLKVIQSFPYEVGKI